MKLTITRIHKHTPTVWSFFMSPQQVAKEAFLPGQVAVLEMAERKPLYVAFASGPRDEEYEFLIRQSDSENSIAQALFTNGETAEISLSKIVGNGFPLGQQQGRDLIFVAMGTGIAPLRSTLREVFRRRQEFGRLVVLHGARTHRDFYFTNEINNEWREQDVLLRQVISQPNEEWSGALGDVQSLLDNIVPELNEPVALICGSNEMMQQTKDRLKELGFTDENILTNY